MKFTKYNAYIAIQLISTLSYQALKELFAQEIIDTNSEIVVARDLDHVIGIDNDLPWELPNDMQNFRKQTLHKVIIMGRKTFDSFPRDKLNIPQPLKNRWNIVVSRATVINENLLEADSCTEATTSFANYLVKLHLEHPNVFIVNTYNQAQILQLLWGKFRSNPQDFNAKVEQALFTSSSDSKQIPKLLEALNVLFSELSQTKIKANTFALIGGQQLFDLALDKENHHLFPIKELVVTEIQHHFTYGTQKENVRKFDFPVQDYQLNHSQEFYGDQEETIKCFCNKYLYKASV